MKWHIEMAFVASTQKAVDILATAFRSTVYMFEVKDPRGNWAGYRNSTPMEALAALVGDKVRDTIAGIVYARNRHPGDHLHVHLKSLMQERSSRPLVILWLEGVEADPGLALTLTTLIERHLVWLKPKVMVTSRALWRGLPGLVVRSLAGAPWTG